ncbi:MAG: stage V sporulation protein K [Sulfobacillus acidophilus]|uniref:Stage V sporulation protein K n=1 Tax=Sulfobacillus acidophilus TaxID=53633 RepID=A0A2T2WET5_9FIRM|nr:MAG: stage V sporulation protein K [Sulfobacillus acidophilus]
MRVAQFLPSGGSTESIQNVLNSIEDGRLAPESAIPLLARGKSATVSASWRRDRGESELETPDAVLEDLNRLVGLQEIKRMVRDIRAFVSIQSLRDQAGLTKNQQTFHMIFSGAPGTGKTTVARIMGRLFKALEVLPKGHLVEVERADLVGEYIGHTAQKTREVLKRALGGVLFIDEAYSLARGGEKDFGKEAIDTLVAATENYRDDLLVILAGYPDEMAWFLSTNPGLLSRFPLRLEFPDYSAHDLVQIARRLLRERDYTLATDAEAGLLQLLTDNEGYWHKNAGNARMVRNLLEHAIRRQAVRLTSRQTPLTRHDLMTLAWTDFEGGVG